MPNLQRGSQLRLESLSHGQISADGNVETEYAVLSWLEVFTMLLSVYKICAMTNPCSSFLQTKALLSIAFSSPHTP